MTTSHVTDAATNTALEPVGESTPDDVDRAFANAERAFVDYSQRSARERAELLRGIAAEIEAAAAELTAQAMAETALPAARFEAERARTVGQLRLIADTVEEGSWVGARIDRGDPARAPAPRPDVRRMLVPLGPVAVFGASNFPLAFGAAGNDTATALGAGCPVVYKAHPAQPDTSRIIADAIARAVRSAGLPDGVFTMLHGWSNDVGLAMVRHPLARAVGFTGSLHGGRALFDAAAARPEPIPVYAEMGSVNPVFVFPSAVRDRGDALARGLAQSIALGVGQYCTNPGVIVAVRDERFDAFRDDLAQRLAAIAPATMLYDRLGASFHDGVSRARAHGAADVTPVGENNESRVARPTLLTTDADRFVADPALREEIFGPVSILVAVRDVAEFERIANAIEGQLTATVHADAGELTSHAPLVRALERKVGRVVFNGYPTGVEVGHAMQHGGPYPASTDARTTSVGTAALERFARPLSYQNFPQDGLPVALRDRNVLGIWRMIDGQRSKEDV